MWLWIGAGADELAGCCFGKVPWSQLAFLSLAGNKLRDLPGSVSGLRSLRALDVSGNVLQELPRGLAHIYTLQVPSPGASPAQPAAFSWEQIQPIGGYLGSGQDVLQWVVTGLFTPSKITLVYLLWYFLIFFTI